MNTVENLKCDSYKVKIVIFKFLKIKNTQFPYKIFM